MGVVTSAAPVVSAAPSPSVPGALRINFEVSEDMPVTAQPAQLEEAPAGCAHDPTSFSTTHNRRENGFLFSYVNLNE